MSNLIKIVMNIAILIFFNYVLSSSLIHPRQSFLNSREMNACHCPKSDFWRSKYSTDVKFSLVSYEYRTHLKGNIKYYI